MVEPQLYVQTDVCRTVDRFPRWKRVLAWVCWRMPLSGCVGVCVGFGWAAQQRWWWVLPGGALLLLTFVLFWARLRYASPYGRVEAQYDVLPADALQDPVEKPQ